MMLYFYVEEPSAETALINLVPNILHGYDFEYDFITFQGKHALLRNLPNRLKAYRHYANDNWRIIVLVDRDSDDCIELKRQLKTASQEAGLTTRSNSPEKFQVLNRIAIEELEAWFFGDVAALVAAYPRVDHNIAQQAIYRDPDAITGGTWERLEKILEHYHPGGLEKIRAAEEISRHMQPERNRSASFQAFASGLLGIFS